MNDRRHNETRLNAQNSIPARLPALSTTEMHNCVGGRRDSTVHCYESPNKVIDEYAVRFAVPCNG